MLAGVECASSVSICSNGSAECHQLVGGGVGVTTQTISEHLKTPLPRVPVTCAVGRLVGRLVGEWRVRGVAGSAAHSL